MDALDSAILKSGSEAYVAMGTSQDADLRYLTQFSTTDPVVYIRRPGEKGLIIVSQMECQRAERESAAAVMSRAQAGLLEILKEENDRWRALARMIAGLVNGRLLVPPQFPYALAKELGAMRELEVDRTALVEMRAVKSPREIGHIQMVQAATDRAMEKGIAMLRKARVKRGHLYQGAVPLTSGMVRGAMHQVLLRNGCIPTETIVSCGEETALPHLTGEGHLSADEPIVIDIFPRNEQTGYYSDMTRTVCRGEPTMQIKEMFQAVKDAHTMASEKIRPGLTGAELHQAVVDLFVERGFESGREGFVHNLGHGVGLEVHEAPSLGPSGEKLRKGNVVTIEPGLYYPGVGGIRIENTGVLRTDGFESLTRFPVSLVL